MAEIIDNENPLQMDLANAFTNEWRRTFRAQKDKKKAALSPEEKARRKEEKAAWKEKYRRKLEKENDPERQAKRARRRARKAAEEKARREAEEKARQEAEKKLKDDVSAVKPGETVKDPKGATGKGFLAVLRKAQDVRNTAVSPSIPDSTKVASVSKGGKDESLVANLRNNLQGRS